MQNDRENCWPCDNHRVETFFLIVVFLPIALDIVVWLRLRDEIIGDIPKPWRMKVAYIGLATNCLAFAMPWVVFVYNYFLDTSGRSYSAGEVLDYNVFLKLTFGLTAVSLGLGILSPKHVRILLLLSALIVPCFWLVIPHGIL